MARITRDTLVTRLVEAQGDNNISKNLKARLTYAMKRVNNAKEVTNAMLADLYKEVRDELAALNATVGTKTPVEASTKPKAAKASTKPSLKPKAAKESPNKVQESDADTVAETPFASFFPDSIEHSDLGTLTKVEDVETFADLRAKAEQGIDVFIVTYWPERLLRKFSYADAFDCPKPEKGTFADDLDIMQPLVLCERQDTLWAMSLYTEGVTLLKGEDIPYVIDKTSKGAEFRVRVSAGMEFELYVQASA